MGTIINALAIAGGSLLGLLLHHRIKINTQKALLHTIALLLLALALGWFLKDFLYVDAGVLRSRYEWVIVVAVLIGTLLGELLDLDGRINRAVIAIEKRLRWSNASHGFLTASVLFCVGTMAVLGPLQEALTGDINTLLFKALIDGISAMLLTSSLGWGVALSSLSIVVYQGTIYALGLAFGPFMSAEMILGLSLVGNFILFVLGLSLAEIKTMKVVNMLPSLVLIVGYFALFTWIS